MTMHADRPEAGGDSTASSDHSRPSQPGPSPPPSLNGEEPFYALVQLGGDSRRAAEEAVQRAVGPFADRFEMARYAERHEIGRYAVAPLAVATLLQPPGGSAESLRRTQAGLEAVRVRLHWIRGRLMGNAGTILPWAKADVKPDDVVGLISDLRQGCDLATEYLEALRDATEQGAGKVATRSDSLESQ